MTMMQIPITKGKGFVEFDTETLPDNVFSEAVYLGLKEMANRNMSKITVAKLEGDDLAKAQAAAMEIAAKNVEAIKEGKVRIHGAKASVKVSGAAKTEAMRLARNIIKDAIKAAGHKISHYKASAITEAAKGYLEDHPEVIQLAEENLAKRAEAPKVATDILSMIKEDPTLVAKAAEKGKVAKGQASAKQAGMVAKKAKPATQPTAH